VPEFCSHAETAEYDDGHDTHASSQWQRKIALSRSPLPARGTVNTVVCHIIAVTVDFQTTFEDVLVCDLVLMALLTLLFLSLSTEHVVFFCVLRVLAVFGLNATLILSLIIIIIIIIIIRTRTG